MKKVTYKGPRDNQEIESAGVVHVVGQGQTVEVTNEIADALDPAAWSTRPASGRKAKKRKAEPPAKAAQPQTSQETVGAITTTDERES